MVSNIRNLYNYAAHPATSTNYVNFVILAFPSGKRAYRDRNVVLTDVNGILSLLPARENVYSLQRSMQYTYSVGISISKTIVRSVASRAKVIDNETSRKVYEALGVTV